MRFYDLVRRLFRSPFDSLKDVGAQVYSFEDLRERFRRNDENPVELSPELIEFANKVRSIGGTCQSRRYVE
jgi:hypothetical protein